MNNNFKNVFLNCISIIFCVADIQADGGGGGNFVVLNISASSIVAL
jgi:hypothetical protein